MNGLRIRLALDAACWIGITIALLYFNHPTIAAFVGAFGIVYLYKAFKLYKQIKETAELIKHHFNNLPDE